MRLSHNMFSANIYNNYKKQLTNNSGAVNNISSGLKLNSAKDNPNKITQSQMLKIQVLSNAAAKRNIEDTNSMIQTFDGAMQEMNDSLSRIKELTVQAGGGTLTIEDRQVVQKEVDSLTEHLDYMAKNTEFNGVKLINGEKGEVTSMIGGLQDEVTTLPKFDLTSEGLGFVEKGTGKKLLDVTNQDNIGNSLELVDSAIQSVSSARSKYGAIQLRLEGTGDAITENSLSLEKSQSNIADADIAFEMLKFSESQILIQSSISLMAQSNNFPQDALNVLKNIR
ncbi:UNVERIFIED_ORG: flagellin [Clostridium botulinum]|uniref:Flagellin n=1 Tax=Clostridium botulinum TaxID=1491 RepID=A0A6B4JM34_CLOBO|nr:MULTISPECIES: flagellin [Clostridium]ACD52552.1 flagellin [Clostridium botulinum E3 str. Alaska E43]AJF28826.1 flagellin [Clostridium botulinum]AJF31887.1 flagellin [Clostridium botulinum]EES49835.1 flagellin [Clostridium botulinum E1 str. 'BoNT E Beluga']KIL09040.1 flagellin [Clostridium botulinum]